MNALSVNNFSDTIARGNVSAAQYASLASAPGSATSPVRSATSPVRSAAMALSASAPAQFQLIEGARLKVVGTLSHLAESQVKICCDLLEQQAKLIAPIHTAAVTALSQLQLAMSQTEQGISQGEQLLAQAAKEHEALRIQKQRLEDGLTQKKQAQAQREKDCTAAFQTFLTLKTSEGYGPVDQLARTLIGQQTTITTDETASTQANERLNLAAAALQEKTGKFNTEKARLQQVRSGLVAEIAAKKREIEDLAQQIQALNAGTLVLKNVSVLFPVEAASASSSSAAAAALRHTTVVYTGQVKVVIEQLLTNTKLISDKFTVLPAFAAKVCSEFLDKTKGERTLVRTAAQTALNSLSADLSGKESQWRAKERELAAARATFTSLSNAFDLLKGDLATRESQQKELATVYSHLSYHYALDSSDSVREKQEKALADSRANLDAINAIKENLKSQKQQIDALDARIQTLAGAEAQAKTALAQARASCEASIALKQSEINALNLQIEALNWGSNAFSNLPGYQLLPAVSIPVSNPSDHHKRKIGDFCKTPPAAPNFERSKRRKVNGISRTASPPPVNVQRLDCTPYMIPTLPREAEFENHVLHSFVRKNNPNPHELKALLEKMRKEGTLAAALNLQVKGWTPLALLIVNGSLSALNVFLDYKPDLRIALPGNFSPLDILASRHNMNDEGILSIIQSFDWGRAARTKAAFIAAYEGHEHILKALLECGVLFDKFDHQGFNLLHLLSIRGHNTALQYVYSFLEPYLNIGTEADGATAICLAANIGHSDVVEFLLHQSKLDLNKLDTSGWSCLDHAGSPTYIYNLALAKDAAERSEMHKRIVECGGISKFHPVE